MKIIAETIEELEGRYQTLCRPGMTEIEKDMLWSSLEEEAMTWVAARHNMFLTDWREQRKARAQMKLSRE